MYYLFLQYKQGKGNVDIYAYVHLYQASPRVTGILLN